jgi:hypothetical protein
VYYYSTSQRRAAKPPFKTEEKPDTAKDMTMNTFVSALYRDVTCGTAAVLITLLLSVAFVQSTSVAPGTRPEARHALALQSAHSWFGQPEPAVLVD